MKITRKDIVENYENPLYIILKEYLEEKGYFLDNGESKRCTFNGVEFECEICTITGPGFRVFLCENVKNGIIFSNGNNEINLPDLSDPNFFELFETQLLVT